MESAKDVFAVGTVVRVTAWHEHLRVTHTQGLMYITHIQLQDTATGHGMIQPAVAEHLELLVMRVTRADGPLCPVVGQRMRVAEHQPLRGRRRIYLARLPAE
jgi:hypothetical protein